MNKYIATTSLFISSTLLLSACHNIPQDNSIQKNASPYASQSRLDLSKDFPNSTPNMDLKPFLKKNHWINLFVSDAPSPNSGINFNYNTQGENIRMNLNCSDPNKRPFFLIEDVDGADVYSSDIQDNELMEFVLDQHVFTNPFKSTESENFEKFKQAFYQAKQLTIKEYIIDESPFENKPKRVAGREYSFNNQYAEVLKEPSNYCDSNE